MQRGLKQSAQSQGRLTEIKNTLRPKDYLRAEIRRQILAFKKSDFKITPTQSNTQVMETETCVPGRIPWYLFNNRKLKLKKERVKVGEGGGWIDFTYRDGKFESYLYFANSAEKITQLTHWGVFTPSALTGQVVSAFGVQNVELLSDAYEDENHQLPERASAHLAVSTITQARIHCLQGIERLPNSYDESLSVEENDSKVVAILSEAKQMMTQGEQLQRVINQQINYIGSFDGACREKLEKYIKEDVQMIDYMLRKLNNKRKLAVDKAKRRGKSVDPAYLKTFLSATGPDSLNMQLKIMMMRAIKLGAQAMGQNIAYSAKALDRGLLNTASENAMQLIHENEIDYHNPVLREHQGEFKIPGSSHPHAENKEKKHHQDENGYLNQQEVKENNKTQLIVEFSRHEKSKEELEKGLMAILQIEKVDRIDYANDEKGTATLIPGEVVGSVRSSPFSAPILRQYSDSRLLKFSARAGDGFNHAVHRVGGNQQWQNLLSYAIPAWIAKLVVGIPASFLDFWLGIVGGVFEIEYLSQVERFCWYVDDIRKKALRKNARVRILYDELSDQMHVPEGAVGLQFGYLFGGLVNAVVFELVRGIWAVGKEMVFRLPHSVVNDFRYGLWWKHNTRALWDDTAVLKQLRLEAEQLETEALSIRENLENEYKIHCKQQSSNEIEVKQEPLFKDYGAHPERAFVSAPYELNRGEKQDPFNLIARAVKAVKNNVVNIHRKHPFTGIVFNIIYFIFGAAVMAPKFILKTFGKYAGEAIVASANTLGYAMAGSQKAAAMSAALTYAQIGVGILEHFLHGRKSWFSQIARGMSKNPADLLMFGVIAVNIGSFIKNLGPAGLKEYLDEESGDIGFITTGSFGAKVSLLLFELLHVKETEIEPREKIAILKQELRLELENKCQQKKGKMTAEDSANITKMVDEMTDDKHLEKLENDPVIKKSVFLAKIHLYARPELHEDTKRDLIELAHTLFKDHPNRYTILAAVKNKLYDHPPQSAFSTIIGMTGGYIPKILRCILGTLFLNAEPWYELGAKLKKDFTCLVEGVSAIVGELLSAPTHVVLDPLAEVVVNETFSRADSYGKMVHAFSERSYRVAAEYNQICEASREMLYTPVHALKRETTDAHPDHVISQSMCGLFATPLKSAPTPRVSSSASMLSCGVSN